MTERVIACGEARAPARGKALRIRLTDPGRTFRLEIEHISKAMAARVPGRLVDLLEIASYVFAADQSISRGGDTRRNWGAEWRRKMRFVVPVRDHAFWQQGDVASTLVSALTFLSEDDYRFEFVPSTAPAEAQAYLPFDPDTHSAHTAEAVVLFSGGLDSLAGAVETLVETGGRVALVSHRSAQKVVAYQRELAGKLQARFPGRVLPVRVYATRSGVGDARETTQRSRSFLYTALGFVVAQMFGARRLRLCENGFVSINLPFSEQIVGTMATRTTHPYTVRLIRELLSLVAGGAVDLENPFIWNTKTDVFARLRQHDAADLVRRTVSCSNVRDMTKLHTHCGRCSQCLDRRFAALAAGMEKHDPEEMYATDLLRGRREKDRDRIMALDYARHGADLADMTDTKFFARFGGELTRVLEGFPAERVDHVGEQCHRLHARHGQSIKGVLADAVAAARWQIVSRELPATSLLRTFIAGDWQQIAAEPPFEGEPEAEPAPDQAKPIASVFPLQIAVDGERREASIIGVDTFTGRRFDLLGALARHREKDLEEKRLMDEYRFLSADDLADAIDSDVENVRQLIRRVRSDFAESIAAIEGDPPATETLIQNEPRRGYRLHPEVRLVRPPER